jgi:hypothetical protein
MMQPKDQVVKIKALVSGHLLSCAQVIGIMDVCRHIM